MFFLACFAIRCVPFVVCCSSFLVMCVDINCCCSLLLFVVVVCSLLCVGCVYMMLFPACC